MSLARAQHGVISRRQLLACGVSPEAIKTLVRTELLVRQVRGVFRVAAAPHSFEAALWVAALSTGGVFISATASYLWGMLDQHEGPITVAVGREVKLTPIQGVRIVRSDRLAVRGSTRHGLPVTSRSGAAISHLSGLGTVEATAFADRAIQRRWMTVGDLQEWLCTRAPGNAVIHQVQRTIVAGAEAESERILHRLLKRADIAGWLANHPVRHAGVTVRIDVAFVAQKLAIEVDGFAYHSKRGRYQGDRTKQNLLTMTGWTILRFTWEDLTERPDYVVMTIRSALAMAA
jgi:very-short-patch-repair endonuclease